MFTATTVVLAARPTTSCKDRAREYANNHKMEKRPVVATPPTSLESSLDSNPDMPILGEFVDDCELIRLEKELKGFEARLKEPCVGTFMKTDQATRGWLYTVRDSLAEK